MTVRIPTRNTARSCSVLSALGSSIRFSCGPVDLRVIEIGIELQSNRLESVSDGCSKREPKVARLRSNRSVKAMRVGSRGVGIVPAFRALEGRQQAVVAPSVISYLFRPPVVVCGMTSCPSGVVDRTAARQDFATPVWQSSAV